MILITIISCDYLNLSLAKEYVDDVTIPTQVIKYNQNVLHADQPIKLLYSYQIKLFINICKIKPVLVGHHWTTIFFDWNSFPDFILQALGILFRTFSISCLVDN